LARRDLKSKNTPVAAKSAPGRFIAWCKQEQASLQQQLALMDQRNVLTGENRGSGWVETTADSIERIRSRLAELESLLTETGSATVLKPDGLAVGLDSTIKKVESQSSPRGEMGQKYLVAGKRVSMRLWLQEPGSKVKSPTTREYETVGYVISGSARLELAGQTLHLKAGDSWLVPAGATHHYTIVEPFTAIEATAPPAEVHGRDTPTQKSA
jgi:quercetin dioxygenase-like cupin family protein